MTTPAASTDADPAALLGELIGEHGLAEVAYRQAVSGNRGPHPAVRWEPVLQVLHRAIGLASGLAAGHTTIPNGYAPDPAPCGGCNRKTAVRIYELPWHYVCWLNAGCPVPDTEDAVRAVDASSPAAPTTTAEQPAEAVNGAHSASQAAPAADRATSSTRSAQPAPRRTFDLANDEELGNFAKALRKELRKRDEPVASDEECAAALAAWHGALTHRDQPIRFVSSAGYTGVAVYELLTGANGHMVKPEALTDPDVLALTTDRAVLRTLAFVNPDATPALGQSVTELDVTAQYLGAARSTELGDGAPDLIESPPPDTHDALFKQPGYVQLGTAPDLSRLPLTARLPFAKLTAGMWLPAPHARYLSRDHHLMLDITRARTWPGKHKDANGKDVPARHGRRLTAWCALFADGRATLSAAAETDRAARHALIVLKAVYATFLGGMVRSEEHNDKGTLRADWWDQYVANAGVNALRAIDKTIANGATVLGGMKDSFWFLADTAPVEPVGLTIADQPGKWHRNRWAPVTDEMIRAHGRGRPGLLRDSIIAANHAREQREQEGQS